MKILMRAHIWPERSVSQEEMIVRDQFGGNIGNELFVHGVARWVLNAQPDMEIKSIREGDLASSSAEKLSKEYDMLLLPFANAFRKDYIPFLKKWTALIKKMTIPCIVVGIGIQAALGKKDDVRFEFDQDVIDFCNAVLEKSSSIGVRGKITKDYLVRIGIPAEKVKVIGCPSMFVHGKDFIPIKKVPFETLKKFSFNTSKMMPGMPLVKEWMSQYPNSEFIPQERWELMLLYANHATVSLNNGYFVDSNHEFMRNGRIHSFTDTLSWTSYMHHYVGLSVGTRIHGNIAALMAGVPALIIAGDTRVKEICDVFAIPYRTLEQIKENVSLQDWYESTDFEVMNQRYPEVLEVYEEFYKENRIPYKMPEKRLEFLTEEILELKSCFAISKEENLERMALYNTAVDRRYQIKDVQRQNQIKHLRNVLKQERDKNTSLAKESKAIKEKYDVLNTMSVSEFLTRKLKRFFNRIFNK